MSESAVKTGKNGERSIGAAANRQKKSSFQITSVTATRMSNDGGDDSADDLDESHTDDFSRVTEGENETPSFSEDTFSKDDVFFNPGSTSLGSAPVIPTSSQYGLAIVTTNDSPTPGPDAVDVINIGNVKTEASEPHVTTRNERFKVVKIESTEPFKRGRWQCMDYLDHSGYDEDNHSAEQSIQISTPKPAAPTQSHNAVPNSQGVTQPQSMPHQQIQQVVPPAQGQTLPHSQPVNNGPIHNPSQPVPQVTNMVPNSQPPQHMPTMVPASQPQQIPNMVPPSQPQPQQQPIQNMVPANQPLQQQSMPSMAQQPPQQMPTMVPASQPQPQQLPAMVPTQTHPPQVPNMVQATQVPTMVAAQQPMVPVSGVVSQPVSQVTNIVPQTQQIPSSAGQSQGPQLTMATQSQQPQMQMGGQAQQTAQMPMVAQSQQTQMPLTSQNQNPQMPMGSQSQPQSLTTIPQALQQAGQQQMQQQLMQQQMQQQQMQYFPQTMHQGANMMGIGHPMPQYPVQMPGGYGQPSYVPTMPQLLPQQMMPANFQNFQQQPTSSPSFPNSVTASGGLGYNQSSQPVMSYPSQAQHPGMAAYMVPQMVPQPQVPAPVQPQEHASELQVSVALLESLVEATANSEQVQGNEDAESLFPSRLAQALTAYRERLSAARLAQAAQSRAPSPSPSASGTSAVAIDNKIEQAMDLVKSHLMFAVREEVEVLREKIAELMERINLLEMENAVLKSQATPETLATLAAQVSATSKTPAPGGGPPN